MTGWIPAIILSGKNGTLKGSILWCPHDRNHPRGFKALGDFWWKISCFVGIQNWEILAAMASSCNNKASFCFTTTFTL